MISLMDISETFNSRADCGAEAIKLIYKKGELRVEILCNDDCEPYWDYGMSEKCSVENYAKLLTHIVNGEFIRHRTGTPYPVICKMED